MTKSSPTQKPHLTPRHAKPLGGDTARSTRSSAIVDLSERILNNEAGSQSLMLLKKPSWIRATLPSGEGYRTIHANIETYGLHTVCQEASCPNIGDCWSRGTATIMILGDICTRSCGFCNVKTGRPLAPDYDEPKKVGKSVALMGLRHIVITCVDRDDLPDGGAQIWAETIDAVHSAAPQTSVEALVGDLRGYMRISIQSYIRTLKSLHTTLKLSQECMVQYDHKQDMSDLWKSYLEYNNLG